ncbi:hypothetical protein [Streptomyces himastatinicus]|uniref:hypothetical protein n=1 Tax=Streptomyces himastatinicus TaxID=998084 RepID=UPI0003022D90|nr:hypothetical protein [Streptomyces himastatinicus]
MFLPRPTVREPHRPPRLQPRGAAADPSYTGRADEVDIAEAATFLCSPAACYITGVVLDVDVDGGIGIGPSIR